MARLPPSLRVAALLMIAIGAMLSINFLMVTSLMVLEPDYGQSLPGGVLHASGPDGVEVMASSGSWNQTCVIDEGSCTIKLARTGGTVSASSTNQTLAYYLPQGVTGRAEAGDVLAGDLHPGTRDVGFAVLLMALGVAALYGGAHAWRLATYRAALVGAGALAIAGLMSGILIIGCGGFALWGVTRNKWLFGGPTGTEEE